MGRFSRDTYKLLKQPDGAGFVRDYRNVRLQMGVPLVDADWNELEDIRKHELRSLVAGVVGSGLPTGSNGFEIYQITNDTNNQRPTFKIRAGSILVDGMMVTNPTDIAFEAQEYYGVGAGLQRANQRGVTPVAQMAILTGARVDNVYLEVWEREVTAAEDPRLMDNVLLEETSTRMRLEWAVRVITGSVPASTESMKRLWLAKLVYVQSGEIWCDVNVDMRRTASLVAVSERDRIVSIPPFGHPYLDAKQFYFDGRHARTLNGNPQSCAMGVNVALPHGARLLSFQVGGAVKQGTFEVTFSRTRYGGGQQDDLAFLTLYNETREPMDIMAEVPEEFAVVDNGLYFYHIVVSFWPTTSTSYCRVGGFQIKLKP